MTYLTRAILFLAIGGLLLGMVEGVSAAGGWDIIGQHEVRPGETLFCIGRAYGVDPWAIATQNDLSQPSRIYSGMVLAIPDAAAELPLGPVCAPQFEASASESFAGEPVAPVETPTPTPEPATQPLPAPPLCGGCTCQWMHIVAAGETLTRVSLRYGRDLWTIARCNCIQNVNFIRTGDLLCIP